MKALRHCGVVVSDIEKSLHFYRDLLGMEIQVDMLEEGDFIDTISGLKGIKVRTVKMTTSEGTMRIELLKYFSHKGKERKDYEIQDLGASHIAFTVNDIEFEYKRLKKEGVNFISSPQLSVDKKHKVVFCHDPDGVPIELVQEL